MNGDRINCLAVDDILQRLLLCMSWSCHIVSVLCIVLNKYCLDVAWTGIEVKKSLFLQDHNAMRTCEFVYVVFYPHRDYFCVRIPIL